MPVSLSKFIIDLCIGAAPLHLGSNEPCILIKPFLVKFKNSFGIICPYATTIARSASKFFINWYSSRLFLSDCGARKSKFKVSEIP